MERNRVPIQEKLMLTFEEAAEYSGIGINKIREIAKGQGTVFVFNVGKKNLIKRKAFEKFIDENSGI